MIFREAGRVVPVFLVTALALLLALYWTLPFLKPYAKAETQTVFGPKQYALTTTTPQTASTVVRTSAGRAHLHVINGAPDGSARLTHASITLNGLEILSPQDLGLHVAVVDKPVTLLPINVLTVTISGPVNGTLEVTLERRAASLTSVTPDSGRQGETVVVSVEGSNTHFVQGATRLWAGPGISVGGAPPGELGPVTVEDLTHLTATLVISPTTVLGPRTLLAKTNGERAALPSGFTVLAGTSAVSGTTVTTLAGSGSPGLEDGTGSTAEFRLPFDVAARPDGSAVVADTGNSKLRQVAPDGTVSTVSLPVTPLFPAGVTVDSFGRTVIADTGRCVIRIVNPDATVTTIGKGSCGFANGPPGAAQFKLPRDVAGDATGNLYVADTGNFRVRRIDPQGNVTTLAGAGTFGGADGPAATATFGLLSGIAVASDGSVLVTDAVFHKLRRIAPDGTVSTIAGTGTAGFADGTAASAQFAFPTGLSRDGAGNLYIADTVNNLLRRLTPQGAVETVAGTGARGDQDGPGTDATFALPLGVGLAPELPSQVFLADTFNHKIRVIRLIAGPAITSLSPTNGVQGETLTLAVTGTNLSGAIALGFLKDGAADPDITASGITVDSAGATLTASVTIASGATRGSRVVTVTTPGGTSSSTGTGANTFTVLSRLTLAPSLLTVAEGATSTITVSIGGAAPAGGTTVTLSSAGPSIATVTSPVTIAEGATSATATVTGVTEGITNITASAGGFADAIAGVNVTASAPTISNFTPGAGKVGETVTISGTGFRLNAAANTVSFSGPNNTRVTTPVTSATSTQLVVKVLAGAITGPLQVSTTGGTAASSGHFIVLPSQDFTLNVAPGTAQVVQGSQVSFAISAAGQEGFAGVVSLAAASLPPGLTGTLSQAQIGPGGTATLTVNAAVGATPGTAPITITGTSIIEGAVVGHQQTVNISVLGGGITALTGRVLDTENKPVQGVTLRLAGQSTTTDAGGNFLLQNIPAGPDQFLFIDGSTAVPDRKYPTFPALVTIEAGKVNVLPFTPFLHPQKTTGFVDISNSGVERVVTDPELPGVELRIPAGVTITGWDGQPNTRINVNSVPLDRIPLPHPDPPIAARSVYFFYFDKVGGGTPSQPVPFTAPNDLGLPPGAKTELWYYDEGPTPDSATQRWQKAGTGTVSADGKTISTDPGVGLPRFCCGAACFACATGQCDPPSNPRRDGSTQSKDPVDLNSGVFVFTKTDMVLPGRLPVTVTRTYRTLDSDSGVFGIGWSSNFDLALQRAGNQISLILPGKTVVPFTLQTDGSFAALGDPGHRGSRITLASDGSATLRLKDGARWNFPAFVANFSQLRSMVDRNGNTIAVTRDSIGRVTALTEPGGRQIVFGYASGFGPISELRDPLGRSVGYEYDAQGRLARVTDPGGGVTQYTYDDQHRMVSTTDPRNITFTRNVFGASGRVIRQIQADGGETRFAYMLSGAQVTGPGCPGPTCPEVESEENIQRGFSFRGGFVVATTVTDPRGNTTRYRFNNFGDLIEQIDALGQSTKFERAFGTNLLLSTTDPLGRVTRFTYDDNGNVTSITDPAGNIRSFEYEPTFNRLAKITDPLANVTQFAYDGNGNLTSITDPLNHVTQIAYNQFGQPVSTTDPLGNVTQFEYDTVGNLVSIIDPLGNTTSRKYDTVSRLIAQIDPRGKTTSFNYDDLNRITEIVDALNSTTTFTYDSNGNLLTVTDARGSVTTHTYDSMDRLATRTDPLGRDESYQYDSNGNLAQFTDRKGQVSAFTYDALDRRTRSNFADGTFTEFTLDAAGRLTRASDSQTGTIVEEYDTLDRLIRETTPQGTIGYAYDALGRRTTMTVDGQPPVAYTYDAASRLRTITQPPLSTVTIDYDAMGRRTLLTLPNAVSTEYQYDPASRLTALIYRNATGLLGDLTYEYDPAGNRTAVGGSFARTLLPDPVLASTYDAANQQLAFGDKAMAFDANGNLASITDPTGTTTFTWDSRNRLLTASSPTVSGSFQYDALGRRIRKIIDAEVASYQYDAWHIAREISSGVEGSYIRTINVDETLVRAGERFYLGDALGSTLALADTTGSVATEHTYEPFGVTSVTGLPSLNAFQYTGRENDGIGLYHYRYRYYHPGLKRFISRDPIGLLAGTTNLYVYVQNNPLRLADPAGLLVNNLIFRGISIVFRTGATAYETGIQALFADSVIGGGAAVAEFYIPHDVKAAEIPGSGGLSVGTGLDILSGYGGVRTLTLTRVTVSSAGLSAAPVSTVAVGATFGLGLLAFAGGFEGGTFINNVILNNPNFFYQNPVEVAFCFYLFDCTPRPAMVFTTDKGRFERGR
jgi:RHS repeat-associated protein